MFSKCSVVNQVFGTGPYSNFNLLIQFEHANNIESVNQSFAGGKDEGSGKLISLGNEIKVGYLIKSFSKGLLVCQKKRLKRPP